MMRRLWGTVTAVGLVAVGLGFGSGPALAAGKPLDLITSPLPINLVTEPGKTVTTELRIKQGGSDTERLKVTLMKFGAFGDEGKPQILDRQPGDDYFDWVKFDRPVFDAPPNEWQTIKMTITVPKTAAFGYYYAAVFTRVGDDTAKSGNTSALAGGTAILVLLDAHVPNAVRSLELVSLASTHRVFEFLPANFMVKFKNTGNVHIIPHGDLFIMQGKKNIATLPINGAQGNILPKSNRIFDIDWLDGFPHWEETIEDGKVKKDAKGGTVRHLVWSNGGNGAKEVVPHVRLGKYTAHLFAVYDNGGRDVPIESSVDFWVVPWRFLLVVLVILTLAGVGVYMMVRGAWRGARRLGRRR